MLVLFKKATELQSPLTQLTNIDQIITFTDDDTTFGILDMNHDGNILAIGCNKTIKVYELSYASEWE